MKGKGNRNAEIPLIGVVLVVIGIMIVVSSVLLIPFKSTEVDENRSTPSSAGLKEVDLTFYQGMGSIEIVFVEPSEAPVLMTVSGDARQSLLASGDPIDISWSHEIVGDTLMVDARIEQGSFGTYFIGGDPATKVSIAKGLKTNIDLEGGTSVFMLTAIQGSVLGDVQISQSTGPSLVTLDGCALEGDLRIVTTTGINQLEWTDLQVASNVLVDIETTTGGLGLQMVQTKGMGGNVTLSASATTGGLDLWLSIEGETSARVSSSTDLGGISVSTKAGFSGSDELLTSDNYPSNHQMDLTLETTLGGVSIGVEYEN